MEILTFTTALVRLACGVCNMPFAIPENLYEARLNDGGWFWCPSGHRIHYYETENERLATEKAALERRLEWQRSATRAALDQAATAERHRRAAKGQLTKARNRIANGVCPCCNRTFVDVQRHMASKHPDYATTPKVERTP
jgi:hypothetical protein